MYLVAKIYGIEAFVAILFRLQEVLDREQELVEEKRLINEHAEQLKESLKV